MRNTADCETLWKPTAVFKDYNISVIVLSLHHMLEAYLHLCASEISEIIGWYIWFSYLLLGRWFSSWRSFSLHEAILFHPAAADHLAILQHNTCLTTCVYMSANLMLLRTDQSPIPGVSLYSQNVTKQVFLHIIGYTVIVCFQKQCVILNCGLFFTFSYIRYFKSTRLTFKPLVYHLSYHYLSLFI